jgi:hypothetical protein
LDSIGIGIEHKHNLTSASNHKLEEIPILPPLQKIIDATPTGDLTFLVTGKGGRPFTAAGFGNWFRDRCDEAGLSHCSAHVACIIANL